MTCVVARVALDSAETMTVLRDQWQISGQARVAAQEDADKLRSAAGEELVALVWDQVDRAELPVAGRYWRWQVFRGQTNKLAGAGNFASSARGMG